MYIFQLFYKKIYTFQTWWEFLAVHSRTPLKFAFVFCACVGASGHPHYPPLDHDTSLGWLASKTQQNRSHSSTKVGFCCNLRHWSSESFFLASNLLKWIFFFCFFSVQSIARRRIVILLSFDLYYWGYFSAILWVGWYSVCVSTAITADNKKEKKKNSNNATDNNKFVALFTFTSFTWLALPIWPTHGAWGVLKSGWYVG